MSYGFAGHIGLAKETNWGSGTSATHYIEAMSEDLSLSMERFAHKAIIGSLAEPDDVVGLRRIAGSINFSANPLALGHFLKGVFQSQISSQVVAGLWQTTFQTTSGGADFDAQVPHQPYSLEIFRDVTSSIQYTGCLVDALVLKFETNQAVMCEARLIGRGQRAIAKTTPTFPSSPSKPFTFDTVSLSLGGAATALIESLEVEVSNNFVGLGALNLSTDIAKIRRDNHQMVNVKGTLDFTNIDEYLNFVNQTEQRMTISAFKPSSFGLVIDIPRMVYTAFPLGIPGRERITVDFTGKGFYNAGSGKAINVILTSTNSFF